MNGETFPSQGTLDKYSVLRLLQGIADGNRGGCLRVTRDGVERKLYVREGMIIYASSTESQDRLGEIFVTQGKLSREEVEEVLARSREQGSRLGAVLLVEGRITSLDLFQGVTVQVVSIIERMRSWRKGDFVFDEGDEPPSGVVLMRIPLSLYLGAAARKKKAGPRREEGEKAADLPGEAGGDADDDDFEEEVIFEDDPHEEMAPSIAAAAPPPEEGSPAPAEGLPDEAAVPAVGQAWGEVVFPEDKADKTDKTDETDETDGDNGEEQAAEALFHIQELRRRRGSAPHTLLGVKGDASKKEIQEAYHYLAAVLHPDRHHPDLAGDLAEEMIELFKEVAAAYEELTAGGKLAKVTQHDAPFPQSGERMSAPSESLDPGDETRRLFYKAKGYISGGNYWQAVDSLRQVVRRKPKDADCRNLLGFCLMQTGRRLHEAEEHLEEAIRLDPGNPDYLINLGLVYKAGRSYKKARAIFQQALLYNKNHAMARQELKNLPRDIEWGRESGGFWKKIFSK